MSEPWQTFYWFKKRLHGKWREAKMVLLVLLALESILYIAYRQAEVVRKLTPTVENTGVW